MKYLTEEEIHKILRTAQSPYDLLFEVLYKTGVRISEARELTPQSVDERHTVLKVRCLKRRDRNLYRYIPLQKELLSRLKEYSQAKKANERLFPHTATWYWMVLQKLAKVLKIDPKRMHPHAFRHAFGVHATLKRVPLPIIKTWMGHADIGSTQIYTEVMALDTKDFYNQMWDK